MPSRRKWNSLPELRLDPRPNYTHMNENDNSLLDFNRRDFLKSGSVATLMTMLGGV